MLRLLVGTFMTSLDMAGVSITIWPVTSQQLERLDAPSQVGWADCLCSTDPMSPVSTLESAGAL